MAMLRTIGLSALCVGLGGSAVSAVPSADALAALDPIKRAKLLCSGPSAALDGRLRLARSIGAQAGSVARMPLLEGLPPVALAATSRSESAKRYFGQGLMLAYGFNHQGAIRSFREAQRLDPNCALCFWGEALAHGPNINAPMAAGDRAPAWAALQRALALKGRAAPHEQALIDALATRYSADPAADRATLDKAYAAAMMAVAERYPSMDDVQVLAAEAVMDTRPWDYWEGGAIRPEIAPAVRLADTVAARNPRHPQAIHLRIHLYEASDKAGEVAAASDRLAAGLAPGAGHLVHMPAHIYFRIGRYRASIDANVKAALADEAYLRAAGDNGLYRYGYYPHNVHFLVSSAQMAGDMTTAVRESGRLSGILDDDLAKELGWLQMIHAAPALTYAQFEGGDALLARVPATSPMPLVAGLGHYARAAGHALKQDRAGFDAELGALRAAIAKPEIAALEAQLFPAGDVLRLAEAAAQGRWAMAAGDWEGAVRHFTQAAEIEGKLPYLEPPIWSYPIRQSLGAALFKAGRHAEAKAAFMSALAAFPANGWVLWGLAQTERALGNRAEAAAADMAFRRAWLGDPRWLRMERL